EQVYRYARRRQTPHLPGKIQPGVVIFPVAVIQITGNHHKVDIFVDRNTDKIGESLSCSGTQHVRRRIRVSAQSGQGAIQMDIGGVDESHKNNSFYWENPWYKTGEGDAILK